MKKLTCYGILLVLALFGSNGLAQTHHHAKHNMLLFGENEVFASHIVYKVPHNFQVVLKVRFDDKTNSLYLFERRNHPQEKLIFLLDEMDIKDIQSLTSISGKLLRVDSSERKVVFAERVSLSRDRFSVLFFNELPASLE